MESMMHERRSHRIYVSAATGRLGPKGRGPTYCYWVDMRCERSGGENWQGKGKRRSGETDNSLCTGLFRALRQRGATVSAANRECSFITATSESFMA